MRKGAFAFAGLEQLAGWESVMGLQFENLVVNNLRELPGPLHVGNALVYEGHLAPIVEADGYFDAIVPFRRLQGL